MTTNRRNFLQTLGAGAAGIGMAPFAGMTGQKSSKKGWNSADQELFVGDDIAITNTEFGKVQGFILRGIFNFRGIPYGADTSGKNRFMPPQNPEIWNDIKPTVWWGNTAPQIMDNRYGNAWSSFADHWNYDDVSEDCLKLNVWTPSISDNKKRPVLVWLHGGGYTNGNGIEQDGYDGENFARKGEVVFVSINHRLGPIGFSDLSGVGGSKYANSGNVGALDMVAALKWVSRNIANFGGDPANVTIMGQSGGGAKVCTLMAMPAAKGLFHKAVPLSGSSTSGNDPKRSKSLGEYILKEAGLRKNQIDKLQEMPWKEYLLLANKASQKFNEDHSGDGFRGGFSPVQDGKNIVSGTYFSEKGGLSNNVPMLICTTFHEWGMSRTNAEMEAMNKGAVVDMLRERAGWFMPGLGDKAPAVYDAYARIFPKAKPIEILTLISSNRNSAVSTANAKAKQDASVYMAWFGWEPDLFNGRMRAFHCLDICFWFNNTDKMLTHTGGGARPRALGETMSDALLAFMNTGKPSAHGLPEWKEYTPEHGETMILDDYSELKNDPDRAARELLG